MAKKAKSSAESVKDFLTETVSRFSEVDLAVLYGSFARGTQRPDSNVLDARLESLRRCIDRVERHTPASPETLLEDDDARDIISVNFQGAVQICVDPGAHEFTP